MSKPLIQGVTGKVRRLPRTRKDARFPAVSHRGLLPSTGVNGQAIGSTVSDAIVSSWLWSTATKSRPIGYFSSVIASTQLIIDPTQSEEDFSLGDSWP